MGVEARRPAWVGTLATFSGGLVLLIALTSGYRINPVSPMDGLWPT